MSGPALPRFVLHDHAAKHHHFDLRIEHDGVLKSWAVPKGLPENPGDRRLAIAVEDHDLSYAGFEGTIPEGEYGAGRVSIADAGTAEVLAWGEERIEVILSGRRFLGKYLLVRFRKAGEKEWLVMKAKA
ncbi:MAG: ATP-dependent DNA ligase [Methanomicrobiales archaeon]|nr:ATP-dependent DNA ligase [Methanomicrobiales archaeon]